MKDNNQALTITQPNKPVKKKRKKLDVLPIKMVRTKQYLKQLQKMTPEEAYDLQMRQLDAMILSNKEACIVALEKCTNGGDRYDLEEYKTLITASMALANEKQKLGEFYQLAFPNRGKQLPQSYQAPSLTDEEWQSKYKPSKVPTVPKKDPAINNETVYVGPLPDSVN